MKDAIVLWIGKMDSIAQNFRATNTLFAHRRPFSCAGSFH
jgi:hypothetical protein